MSDSEPIDRTDRTPLFETQHAARYERQRLVRDYQEAYDCRLVVLIDALFDESITLFEETIYDADPEQDLHVMLATLGGDGETAIRLARQAQAHCRKLTIIVPDYAKSAGTLFAIGAHRIMTGPTSDLGPVDPQFLLADGTLAAAKAIIAAVNYAEHAVQDHPETYPIHAYLLGDISALMAQQARDAIAHSAAQLRAALACHSDRSDDEVEGLAQALHAPLIEVPQSHGASISASDALSFGLPIDERSSSDVQWQQIWRLWARYWGVRDRRIYEGAHASQVLDPWRP